MTKLTERLPHAETVPGPGNVTVSRSRSCQLPCGLHCVAGEADDQITRRKFKVIAMKKAVRERYPGE